MFQHDLVSFAADAGLLVTAEGSARGNRIVRIDPNTARLYTAADLHGRIQAACENAATTTTGPKISSWHTRAAFVFEMRMVGFMKKPLSHPFSV